MKIFIASPLAETSIGGPSQYVAHIATDFHDAGHEVEVTPFTEFLRYPSGIRHVAFFYKVFKEMRQADVVLIFDTVSVAVPTILAALLRRKKTLVRIGGDFLWEQYVERTKQQIQLSKFYESNASFSLKEKIIFIVQKQFVLRLATHIVFSTEWQKNIWQIPYALKKESVSVIENAYNQTPKEVSQLKRDNHFVWIGRDIVLKNVRKLREAFSKIAQTRSDIELREYTNVPHSQVIQIVQNSRALIISSLSEVSPNLAIEALSVGTPVILTNDCGIKPALSGFVTWINPLSVESITEALEKFQDETTYDEIRKTAGTFETDRSYRVVAQDFLKLIDTLI